MDDTKRLDFLDDVTYGYGKGWVLRLSTHGRGLRLHESSREEALPTVREAIDDYIERLADSASIR